MENETHYIHLFHKQVQKYGERVALRSKVGNEWREISWTSFGEKVRAAAKALVELGVGEQERIGIFSQNMPEWTIADLAALSIRAVPVAIYATSTAKQAEYIIKDAGIRIVFVGAQEQLDKILTVLPTNASIQKVIIFDEEIVVGDTGPVIGFARFLESGRRSTRDAELTERLQRATADDDLTFIYTSGTTGEPKGVMLTHANVLFQAARHSQRLLDPNDTDSSLCFLPLSHVFERVWTYYALSVGMQNTYLQDPSKIIEFIQEAKPTIMCAVPRFYEKIYSAVLNKLEAASPLKRRMFSWAIAVGREHNNRIKDRQPISGLLSLQYRLADTLVLRKIRDLVGGRIKFFPCAGAPLSRTIEEFFYAVGIFITYGYGLSETTATVSCHEPHDFIFGAVGKPLPDVEVKIDPANNEILIRGGNVMKGYYNKPLENAEVFTADGFLRTGDAGIFADNGELIITDRIKDLIKTSGSKYVAPQLIESLLGADHFIEQAAVIGDQRPYVTALLVPNFVNLEEYAASHAITFSTRQELIENPQIIAFYKTRVDHATRELAQFERIKKFTLLHTEFSVDSGEITPTLKIKRRVIVAHYKDLIDVMYGGDELSRVKV